MTPDASVPPEFRPPPGLGGSVVLPTSAAQKGRPASRETARAVFAPDTDAPAAARLFVDRCLHGRVAGSQLDAAQLLVSELVTNSVRHSGVGADEDVVVRVRLTDKRFHLEVEDRGRDGVIAIRAPDADGGFGLNLVHTLSERWGVERITEGGNRVWAQVCCRRPQSRPDVAVEPALARQPWRRRVDTGTADARNG
jgi:anti-sigma regulatory factor (Ser/Thr protein kinase)